MRTKHFSVLSDEGCTAFINSIDRPLLNTHTNILMASVIDCAKVQDALVVYEIQPLLSSLLSKKAFLYCTQPFNQSIFVDNGHHGKITIDPGQHLTHALRNEFKHICWASNVNNALNQDAENTLVILDISGNSRDNLEKRTLYKSKLGMNNVYFMEDENALHPCQNVFRSKHMQRFLMSHTGLAPRFAFIENKTLYTKEDIEALKSALMLESKDEIVIKSNYAIKGEGNTFMTLNKLLDYLNSDIFRKKYEKDSIVLIEQVKNEKVHGVFQTHRYAQRWLPNGDFRCMNVYKEEHKLNDSHLGSALTELNEPLQDESLELPLAQLLKTINNTDYVQLMSELLSSGDVIKQFLAVSFLTQNVDNFYTAYSVNTASGLPQQLIDALVNTAAHTNNTKLRNQLRVLLYNMHVVYTSNKEWLNEHCEKIPAKTQERVKNVHEPINDKPQETAQNIHELIDSPHEIDQSVFEPSSQRTPKNSSENGYSFWANNFNQNAAIIGLGAAALVGTCFLIKR